MILLNMYMSYDVMSSYVVSCCVMLCRVMSCRVVSCDVMSCHVVSCHVVSCHVVSCRVAGVGDFIDEETALRLADPSRRGRQQARGMSFDEFRDSMRRKGGQQQA